jgi:flavodoxin
MNIGIIIYSQSGNTLSVAERLKAALASKGHEALIEKITNEGEISPGKPVNLVSKPDPVKYDALVFAAPVMAFSLNPVMKEYLKQLTPIKGKKAGVFSTQQLPSNWMGGNRALKTMSTLLSAKGAQAFRGGLVHWKDEAKRSAQTEEVIAAICKAFS